MGNAFVVGGPFGGHFSGIVLVVVGGCAIVLGLLRLVGMVRSRRNPMVEGFMIMVVGIILLAIGLARGA